MRRAILVALGTGVVISSAAAIGIGAVLGPDPQSMTREGHDAALRSIQAAHAREQARCDALQGDDATLCLAQMRADERLRVAELESAYRRTERAARDAQRARIDARYEVERARCDTLKGFSKDKCLIKVHATKGRALLEAAAPYELRYTR